MTAQLEAAIADLEQRERVLQVYQDGAQRNKADLEQQQQTLQQEIDNASTNAEKRRVIEAVKQEVERLKLKRDEIRMRVDDVEGIVAKPVPAIDNGHGKPQELSDAQILEPLRSAVDPSSVRIVPMASSAQGQAGTRVVD